MILFPYKMRKLFPSWDYRSPTLGLKYSQRGTKTVPRWERAQRGQNLCALIMRRPQSASGIILEMLWDLRLLDASHRVSSRSAELKQGLALSSLNRLFPRILVGYGAVLELLAAEGDLLEVLLAVCPILLVVYTVATCTLQLLHG